MYFLELPLTSALLAGWAIQTCSSHVAQERRDNGQCVKANVVILDGGMAGIAATDQQALPNASMQDFVILEYRDVIGGRATYTQFGKDKNGERSKAVGIPVVQKTPFGLWPETQLEEPVSNYGSILAYDENGYVDYNDVLDEYDEANEIATQEAGVLFMDNLQEQTGRTGYALAGWRPRKNGMKAQAVEWWNWDWENAHSLEESSFAFGIAGGNLTFNQFSEANNLVIDPRGYSAIISGEASTFLKESDPHLRLNIEVKNIEYSKNGITVHNTDGYCVSATYATFTFSLGVLQSKTAISPPRFRFGNGQPSRSSTWAPTRKANCSPTKPSGQMRQSISSTQTPSPAVTILSGNRCLRTISPRSQTSYSQPLSTTNPPASKTSRTKKPKEKPWPPSATCSPADDIPEPAAFTYTR